MASVYGGLLCVSENLVSSSVGCSWLRRVLRTKDLHDLHAGRPTLGRMAYLRLVRALVRTQRAQRVGAACANGLRKVCEEVVRKQGAACWG